MTFYVGKCVAAAEKKNCSLKDLSLDDFKSVSSDFGEDVLAVWNYENSVEQYTSTGGTAKAAVLQQISAIETRLSG